MLTYSEFKQKYYPRQFDSNKVIPRYAEYFRENVQVGDGATVHVGTDAYAYTVIKKTPKTLTLRKDKATLSPDFKPEFVIGGFIAHCTNNSAQTYTYEEDPNGSIVVAHWSDKHCGYYVNGHQRVTPFRREFYDYNF